MTDLDDLIDNPETAIPAEAVAVEDFTVPEADPDRGRTFPADVVEVDVELPTENFITSLVVHNQHLYAATIDGRLFRNLLRRRDDQWEEVGLPKDF